jgi:hypothetical protein
METNLVEKKSVSRWILFAVFALGSSALFLVPAFIIQPFRHQSQRGLMLAIRVKQWAPLGTAVGFLICLALLWTLWPRAQRWGRVGLAAGMVLVTACAVMARLNYFEWMFHPLPKPGFESADKAKVDSGEMVLAVSFNGDARAYPVSQMGYHHIVNDVVGGVSVAVTY